MSIERLHAGPRMSQAVIHGDTIYLAGQVGDNKEDDVTAQTQQVLAKIDKLLAECGSDKSKVLSALVWVSDMALFADMNSVWDAWVAPGNPPARACTEAALASPEWKVEIMVTAAKG